MSSTPKERAAVACVIAKSMAEIHAALPNGLSADMQVVWNTQERIALDLAQGADFTEYPTCMAVLESRARRILQQLPDETFENANCYAFNAKVLLRVLEWITPDHMEIAISKGLIPTQGTRHMIEHAPGDLAWDALITGPFSRVAVGSASSRDSHDFLNPRSVAKVRNLDRLYAYARAQARHHPRFLRKKIDATLGFDMSQFAETAPGLLLNCLILLAAGAPDDGLDEVLARKVEEAHPCASRHERLRVLGLKQDLEGAVAEARKYYQD